ncbi:MAG: carboxypeptidase regulatory-like domain-containing protein [Acidobacteria bacterium]|nr:carboxypeptidase regulatory-like domain-containing protein [Acidobacteriota bacterium]
MRPLTCILLSALPLLIGPAAVNAQQFTGGLRGQVRDPNGVIPGVTVTLTNEATNISREVVTNDVGQYNFPAVPPGTYTIRTQLTGYKTFDRRGVRIGTQQFITLDILLELGAIEESITVTGEAPLIETSTASTGAALDREILETLPAPGRNAFLIAITVPTVNPVGDPQFNRQQDQTNASRISLGGGGIRANNYLLDGVPIGEMSGRAVLNPTIEAVEEIRVQVHTYDAEMGRTGGGVFNTTAKAGTNEFRGTGFYQTRPVWGQELNFFDKVAGRTKDETGVSDLYYRLHGGGVGGPILRNRTFFWTSTEGYRSRTTRNLQELWPSLRQREGDFSRTTISGRPVRLFNPWCRGGVVNSRCPATGTGSLATGGEFLNAVIPRAHPAASPVGFALINQWPTTTNLGKPIGDNENNENNVLTTANIVDEADMWTLKMEHKFTDRWSLSGLYVYNNTDEPGSESVPPSHAFLDGAYAILRRRPHVLVVNDTHILNDTTVFTWRYGWTTFQDQSDKVPFSPGLASLGFSPTFVNAIHPDGRDTFPSLSFNEVLDVGGLGGNRQRWLGPYAINGALSKLWGTHSFKVGADLRRLGITTTTASAMSGSFSFNNLFTSLNGAGGHELASLLLGLPSSGSVPFNRGDGEWFTRYYGAYIQDDWRVNGRFTLNYGVRIEHEDGLREIENRQTVAFDRNAVSPLDALVRKQGTLLEGRTLTGGLIFAGVNGAPEEQGNPPAVKVSPRFGATLALGTRTVLRGGYGLFYAPWQYSSTTHGQIGFARTTTLSQSSGEREVPITTLENPFPAGLQEPVGSSLGLLTGVGTSIDFIDPEKGAPRVHQYSADIQRELPGGMALTIGYTGATGRDIGYGGTGQVAININQIDPDVARRLFPAPGGGWDAAALRQSVPNPFFGVTAAGEFGTRATIQRGQLLRPFPQFGNVNMREMTEGGRRLYHAVILKLDKRTGQSWWGGRYSYTWSNTKDNQFGESSTFQGSAATPQNSYDLDAEYGVSNFDSPHRIILAPIIRIPGPEAGAAAALLRGWTASAVVELVSGSPLNAVLSSSASDRNLGLFGGLQRPNRVGDPNTPGGDTERVATASNSAARWFDRAAFENPGAGRFGTSPRTHGDARYQFRKNLDLVLAKDTRFAGGQVGQIRFEVLNVTNTPKFGPASTSIDLTSFGRITSQRGFMRIWQLSFRYRV